MVAFFRQVRRVSSLSLTDSRLTVSTSLSRNQKRRCPKTRSIIPRRKEKKDLLTGSRLAQLTKDSGWADLEMDLEYKYGLMGPGTRVSGVTTVPMVTASSCT